MSQPITTFASVVSNLSETRHVNFVVHPRGYVRDRKGSLSTLSKAVFESRVSLRGRDLPFCDPKSLIPGDEFVSSVLDSERHVQGWRAYKSCPFELIERCWEEAPGWQRRLKEHWLRQSDAEFYLDWHSTIFSFCEYFEFARRFAARAQLHEGFVIEIEYRNMRAVGLSTLDSKWNTGGFQPSQDATIAIRRSFDFDALASTSVDAARDAVLEFFCYFQWKVRPDIVEQVQRELYGVRAGSERSLALL